MPMLRRCAGCNAYSLQSKCKCGSKTVTPHPAKFSLDKFVKYRRIIKGKKD